MSSPERAVAESELFQALFDAAPDAMIVAGHNGRLLLANPHAESLFGYAPGELIGKQVEVLLPATLRTVHEAHRAGYMASPRVRNMGEGYELTGVRRDGTPFPVEIALSPIVTMEGTLFAASIRDISATQRAREVMRRARYDVFVAQAGRLVLESPHYDVAIDGMPALLSAALETEAVAIVFIQPLSGELSLRASTGLSESLRQRLLDAFSDTELKGLLARRTPSVLTLEAAPGEDEVAIAATRRALEGLGFRDVALAPLFDRVEPMGMLVALAEMPDAFGHDKLYFLQSVANMLAATIQRSRSEEQLAHAQRLEALGQLTGGIAHDFNNLMTVISGNLQLLEAGIGDADQMRDTMASARRAVERCTGLTRKLLGFARRRRLVPTAVQPDVALGGLAEMVGRTLGSGIKLTVDCPTGMPAVYADPGELDTALLNLAINARDAMPAGGELSVSVHERHVPAPINELGLAAGRYVVIEVADSGTGMSREVMKHALEPFFTTKQVGKGSGLGLSMVYGFVRQSGGQLNIDSELGRGTRVELMLPVAATTAVEALPSAPTQRGEERVLVVEDEPDVRHLAVAFLKALGYEVVEAADAASALQLLESQPSIALLFSDVMLGAGMNGVELAHEAQRRYPSLAVLLTSGLEPDLREASRAATELQLLPKPYRYDELGTAVREALERTRQTRRN
ncbi:PAS domain S-box protein [Dyella sp. KULCS107]|uniref:PAS domain S-box protein n=1 Tax=Dyella sp. KULCS107 TaxID=3422216 RepID=UPI003D6E91BF